MTGWWKCYGIPLFIGLVVLSGILLQVAAQMQPLPVSTIEAFLAESIPEDIPGKRVGDRSVVGAGSVVVSDVPKAVTVFGNPARILMRH